MPQLGKENTLENYVISATNTPPNKLLGAVAAARRCDPDKITLIGFAADVVTPVVQLLRNAGTAVDVQ